MSNHPKFLGVEKRRFPRVRFHGPVTISTVVNDTSLVLHGLCRDLTEAGLSAFVLGPLGVGQVVNVSLILPTGIVKMKACVRYRAENYCGLEFAHLADDQRLQIRKVCNR